MKELSKQHFTYTSFNNYSVQYDLKERHCKFMYYELGEIAKEVRVEGLYLNNVKIADLSDYKKSHDVRDVQSDSTSITVCYEDGPKEQPSFSISFIVSQKGIKTQVLRRGDIDVRFTGKLCWGENMEQDTFAVCLDREGQDLRSALGPATSTVDNALFDKMKDAILGITGGEGLRLYFDWKLGGYCFKISTGAHDYINGFGVHIKKNIYADRYDINYSPINKNNTFSKPPVGWMTWYAVQFGACENAVLENATWQAKHLKDFGASVIWVDWEWFHSDFSGKRDDGADSFNPDKSKYPNGLSYVADKIKKLGLTPALWVGFTNDPAENQYIKENPDVLLTQTTIWCGQYFLDMSNPKFIEEYMPKTFAQVLDWGYEALKWDCLPITLRIHDRYHENMYDTSLSTKSAYRNAVNTARNIVGKDFYMLYCGGGNVSENLCASDIFDGVRIGGDIFKWEQFINECVGKVIQYYPMHNVVFYNDPDNVILREKFNTYDQALSRLCFVSLLGLPITFGDILPELPPERVELLKRGVPSIDAHPMDIRSSVNDLRIVKTNLAVEMPFDRWNVVGVLNLTHDDVTTKVNLMNDVHLESGKYLVYDYWEKQFLGEFTEEIMLELRPCATKILCIRKKTDRPQILSTSRHITQGAVDIKSMDWDEKTLTLSVVSSVVANDLYEVSMYLPNEYYAFWDDNRTTPTNFSEIGSNLIRFEINADKTCDVSWSIAFQKK